MDIVGTGFLASHLRPYFGDRHPEVTVIAAGVSSAGSTEGAAFDREAKLVYQVLRRCREQGRTVVFFSTASTGMYAGRECPGSEEGPVFPRTPYGRHKLGLERVCALSGARYLVLRLGYVVGAGAPLDQLLPALARQVRSGLVTVFRGAARDLLDVRYLMLVLDRLLTIGVADEVVNVATGAPLGIEELLAALYRRLGTSPECRYVTQDLDPVVVDTAKLRRLVPEFAELDFGPAYLERLLDHVDSPHGVTGTITRR
ncbi:NAD-dependent epimerase/dehydratase [Amycolatopsis antarctica]|uniref:NAD-dependent epimerase/dehydratase n=1 Tax=Amycolatopsis antarctica TaxID=1854586 RepID=A0A263D6K9_9PSEU|nr:NAD-dependent epimerase/dehydratase family protein [Amycolatopsis antarctica]OZM74154.1 NAD-dependent epimerase/dehydratase [Amycolatopsis antarctica]